MTTGYVLTCGTSFSLSLREVWEPKQPPREGDVAERLRGVLREMLRALSPSDRTILLEGGHSAQGDLPVIPPALAEALAEVVLRVRASNEQLESGVMLEEALRPLGVELESLVRRSIGRGPTPIGRHEASTISPEDPIALIATDSSEGLWSALLVAVATGRPVDLWRGRPSQDERASQGEDGPRDWSCRRVASGVAEAATSAPVEVFLVPGLSVTGEARLARSAPWLADVLVRTVGGRSAPWKSVTGLEVELSGGFKATLPLLHTLLGYCTALRGRTRAPILCVLRHERNPDLWITSGLRVMGQAELALHLEELRTVRRGIEPEHPLLAGFGWRWDGRMPVLTPEGAGIAVFPPPLRQ